MQEAQQKDPQLTHIMQALRGEEVTANMEAVRKTPQLLHLFGDAFSLASDGLLVFQPNLNGRNRNPEPRIVVPACHRQQVFDLFHAHAQSGAHYGYQRMQHSMRQRFF